MFGKRLFSGILLLVMTVVVLFLGGIPLLLVLWGISTVGFLELTKAVGLTRPPGGINLLECVGIGGISWVYGLQIYDCFFNISIDVMYMLATIVFTVIGLLFVYVLTFPKYNATQIVEVVFAFIYVPVMLSFIGFTRFLPDIGFKVVWLIWISAWGSDTFAYCVGKVTGMFFGNHKAFPILSPKKSIEGCLGGIIGATILGALFGYYVMDSEVSIFVMGIICGIGSMIAQCGDLAASAIKRNYDIKDYGTCIPGHGGILDRFDSIIFTAPCIFFLIYFFLDVQSLISM
ncbi:MAG: phosphatidate cytidylyltransferase [Lachnospiraceae bacterium]